MSLLRLAFLIDAIVSGVFAGMVLMGKDSVMSWIFSEKSTATDDIRLLIGTIWLAMTICLALGIAFPIAMSAILIVQLVYKSLWLIVFAAPRCVTDTSPRPSRGTAGLFLAYILIFPWLIPWSKVFVME